MTRRAFAVAFGFGALAVALAAQEVRKPPSPHPGRRPPRLPDVLRDADQPTAPVVLNDDGGWCWFQDERAIATLPPGAGSARSRRARPRG